MLILVFVGLNFTLSLVKILCFFMKFRFFDLVLTKLPHKDSYTQISLTSSEGISRNGPDVVIWPSGLPDRLINCKLLLSWNVHGRIWYKLFPDRSIRFKYIKPAKLWRLIARMELCFKIKFTISISPRFCNKK